MDFKSSVQAVYYITTKKSKSLDYWSILKLIFFADRYHLRKYGRTITSNNYYAMEHGPVASTVYDIIKGAVEKGEHKYIVKYLQYKNNGKNITFTKKGLDIDSLSETDIEALEFALDKFGSYNPKDISNISHMYPEWNKYSEGFDINHFARYDMEINDFFKNPSKEDIKTISEGKLDKDPFDIIPSKVVESAKDLYQGLF